MMNKIQRIAIITALGVLALAGAPPAWAQPWVSFDDNTRYLALGDSLSAGYAAKPVTQGFAFQVYQGGSIDNLNNLLFCDAAVPNAQSSDVLHYQVPQAHLFFADTGKTYRKVVTLTVGGNDAFTVVGAGGQINPGAVLTMLQTYAANLGAILGSLIAQNPDVKIYVGNMYDPKLPVPGEDVLVGLMNQATANVVSLFPGNVVLVDIHAAFLGRSGLLLIEKHGAAPDQIHPTNAGYQVMAKAFENAIRAN
ncbi:MAG: hypothetical protein JWO19_3880 [Bryobacterales bacterium]|nr:hypothetical protein [Bryobacterales bacterium]